MLKKIILLFGVWSLFLLTGCDMVISNDMQNIEQRDYATLLMMREGENGRYHFDLGIAQEKIPGKEGEREELCSLECNSLEELADAYEDVKGKTLSLAHLKVILLNDICPMEEACPYLLELEASFEIAKTVPVLEVKEPDKLMAYLETINEPVGTYMRDLVRIQEKKGKNIPWLKDYLKVIREGNEIIVYDIDIVEEGIQLFSRTFVHKA